MIAPEAEIVELEPEGFARLSEILSHRVYATGHEIHLLHHSGEVLNVVDTREGLLDRYRERFTDPAERAREILARSKVERVVLIDKSRIAGLQAELVTLGRTTDTQTELLWSAQDRFFQHHAVAAAPEPTRSPWAGIFEKLRSLGDDYWAVLGAWKDDQLYLSLIARFQSGVVTFLTSADYFGKRPSRDEAMNLIEMVEERGEVNLALLCDMQDLERILKASDPFSEAIQAKNLIAQRGLQELSEPVQ